MAIKHAILVEIPWKMEAIKHAIIVICHKFVVCEGEGKGDVGGGRFELKKVKSELTYLLCF